MNATDQGPTQRSHPSDPEEAPSRSHFPRTQTAVTALDRNTEKLRMS